MAEFNLPLNLSQITLRINCQTCPAEHFQFKWVQKYLVSVVWSPPIIWISGICFIHLNPHLFWRKYLFILNLWINVSPCYKFLFTFLRTSKVLKFAKPFTAFSFSGCLTKNCLVTWNSFFKRTVCFELFLHLLLIFESSCMKWYVFDS